MINKEVHKECIFQSLDNYSRFFDTQKIILKGQKGASKLTTLSQCHWNSGLLWWEGVSGKLIAIISFLTLLWRTSLPRVLWGQNMNQVHWIWQNMPGCWTRWRVGALAVCIALWSAALSISARASRAIIIGKAFKPSVQRTCTHQSKRRPPPKKICFHKKFSDSNWVKP